MADTIWDFTDEEGYRQIILIFDVMTDRRNQIKQWLKTTLEEHLRDISYRAFIFGSQANRSELTRSDIDLGILADEQIPAVNLVRLSIAIEDLPMLYKIDLVDFTQVDEKSGR